MKCHQTIMLGLCLTGLAFLTPACNDADDSLPATAAQQPNAQPSDENLSAETPAEKLRQSAPRTDREGTDGEQHSLPMKQMTVDDGSDDNEANGLPDLTNPSLLTLNSLGQIWGVFACEVTPQCMGAMGSAMLMSMGGEPTTCKETFRNHFENSTLPALKEATAAGRVVYHKNRLQSCVDAMSNCSSLSVQAIRECSLVLEGTVELGAACTMTSECRDGARCNGCECVPMGETGDECISEEHCKAGLSCTYGSQDDTIGTCKKLLDEGEICNESNDCSWPMLCAPDYTVYDNTCQHISTLKHAKLGQSCHPMMAVLCEEGLSCAVVGQQFKCIKPVQSGSNCSYGLPDPCPSDEFCGVDIIGGNITGQCTPRGTSGASCGSLNPLACAPGYICDTGTLTCTKLRHNGAACASSKQCWSEKCISGFCVAAEPPSPFCATDF